MNYSSLAGFLQKAERKWEERRQNLDHYDGKEFEKLLEEAQANIMKSIPNLEMPPAPGPPPKGDGTLDKLELSGESPEPWRHLQGRVTKRVGQCGATLGMCPVPPLQNLGKNTYSCSIFDTVLLDQPGEHKACF